MLQMKENMEMSRNFLQQQPQANPTWSDCKYNINAAEEDLK